MNKLVKSSTTLNLTNCDKLSKKIYKKLTSLLNYKISVELCSPLLNSEKVKPPAQPKPKAILYFVQSTFVSRYFQSRPSNSDWKPAKFFQIHITAQGVTKRRPRSVSSKIIRPNNGWSSWFPQGSKTYPNAGSTKRIHLNQHKPAN